jgi:hypothetical protein
MLAGMLLATSFASARADTRPEQIRFAPGTSGATIKGKIKGYQGIDYRVRASAGQSMTAIFKSSNRSAYFNVLPPASDTALFIGSTSGDHFEATLPADGEYTIRVYLMRNAARRHETANYTLQVGMGGKMAAPTTPAAGASAGRHSSLESLSPEFL